MNRTFTQASRAINCSWASGQLNCLRTLQALEYCGLMTGSTFSLTDVPSFVPLLIRQFDFRNINVRGGDVAVSDSDTANIDGLLNACVDGPSFLIESDRYLRKALNLEPLAHAGLAFPEVFHVDRHNHLGDLLSVVWGIEEYLRINRPTSRVDVGGPSAIADIIEMLECCHLRYSSGERSSSIADDLFALCSWRMPWMLRYSSVLAAVFGGERGKEACPAVNVSSAVQRGARAKERLVACHFDTRAGDKALIRLAPRILTQLSKGRDIVVIGGPDTSDYLGPHMRYVRGTLRDIVVALRRVELFVGCDSGMAHVAGLLRIPAIVFNFSPLDPVFNYFSGYPNLIVADRRLVDAW